MGVKSPKGGEIKERHVQSQETHPWNNNVAGYLECSPGDPVHIFKFQLSFTYRLLIFTTVALPLRIKIEGEGAIWAFFSLYYELVACGLNIDFYENNVTF